MRLLRLIQPVVLIVVAVGVIGGAVAWIFGGANDVKAAWDAIEAREYDQAIRLATRAIRFGRLTGEDLSRAFECRATASMRTDQLGHALEDLGRIVTVRPDYAGGYFLRGEVRLRQKDYDQALSDLNQGIKIADPDGKSPNRFLAKRYAHRGVVWLGKKDVDHALADFNRSLDLNPKAAETYYFRSFAFERQKLLPQALADMETAVKIYDSNIFSLPRGDWLYRLEQLRQRAKP
jgi:tetratricopeptide (TPR) repeat protein